MLLLLQLCAAHVVADFLLQPDWMAASKRRLSVLGAHGAIHGAVALAAVNLGLNRRVLGAITLLVLSHCVLDYVKARFTTDGWIAFSADQAGHLAAVATAAAWASPQHAAGGPPPFLGLVGSGTLYLHVAGYVGVVIGGGFFVQKVAQSFLAKVDPQLASQKPGLPEAGRYIGWMERSLILTFVLAGYSDAIGFLLAAKALVRFPEIQQDTKGHFAEYFLIGTLTSVGLALVGGLAILKLRMMSP
jgi:hypothetical protein